MKDKNYSNLEKAIEERNLIKCYIKDEDVRGVTSIPLCRSDEFLLAANDYDFMINGFLIIPLRNIILVESRDKDKYAEIFHKEHILDNIDIPHVDLTSYEAMFKSFLGDGTVISMDTVRGFYLGKVCEVGKDSISFLHFDINGEKYSDEIDYEDIYIVYVQDRYTEMFSKYVNSK